MAIERIWKGSYRERGRIGKEGNRLFSISLSSLL